MPNKAILLTYLEKHKDKKMILSLSTDMGISHIQKFILKGINVLDEYRIIIDGEESETEIDVRTIRELDCDKERGGYNIEGFGYYILIAPL